jgi:hypothetical protein
MRDILRTGLALGLIVLIAAPIFGQGGRPPFGGGFGGQGGPGFGGNNPLNLLNNSAVKKELDLTEDQMKQVPEALMKALADVLKPEQLKRLKQIQLQQRGLTGAIQDPAIQSQLKFTGEQKEGLKIIIDDANKEIKQIQEAARENKDFKATFEKTAAVRKERDERLTAVLNADQKKAWEAMIGETFEMPRPTFGGGFGNRPPQKKDGDKKRPDGDQ